MTRVSMIKIAIAAILLTLIWLLTPVYSFFAHRGHLPFTPLGWETMQDEAPVTQEVLDPAYAQAGNLVMQHMAARRETIGAPALSAAVAIDSEIVWRGAVGWADMQSKRPATPKTVFRIGSTSKALTATALARMVDRGEIDLDAPISTYLGELPNSEWKAITPRQLASHMAGVPHYGQNGELSGLYQTITLNKHFSDVRDAVALFDASPLLFDPGTEFEYSSLGTVLLGAVMSAAVDKPYRQIIKDEVLVPAGASSTVVAPKQASKDSAFATFYFKSEARYREWRPVDLSHRLPGGGWASTPSDLVRIGALQLDSNYISTDIRDAFWTPQKLANGETNEQDYAIGWRWREWDVESVGVARNANHGGVSRGSQSWLLVFPDYNMTIAFNINSNTDEFRDFGLFYQDIFREFALTINLRFKAYKSYRELQDRQSAEQNPRTVIKLIHSRFCHE